MFMIMSNEMQTEKLVLRGLVLVYLYTIYQFGGNGNLSITPP